jgi:glycosyltransferase involved in cell wall biosynthesis
MEEYDVVIPFGLGPVYAFFACVPFIHYPYGGDLTLVPFNNNSIGSLQRSSLRYAQYVIVGDPGYLEYLNKLNIESKAVFLPFMIDADIYRPIPKNEAMKALEPGLFERIQNKFTFFVPSRQDFYWKGSDKILVAFSKLVQQRSDVFMILSGWGNDLERSKKMVNQLNLVRHTLFLPYIMSKKRLIIFYSLVDAVIDQFNLGAYGTSTMEAMACGKPVIIDFDMDRYAPYFKELPPVVRARSTEEIYSQMQRLSEDKSDICEHIGRRSREWIMEFHGIKNNFDKLIKLCQKCVREPK